jgi:hypothetical protein
VINLTYSGNGDAGKRFETHYAETENGVEHNYTDTIYYVRSSVLGGVEIVGLNEWGGKLEGHVYAGGQKLTDQWGLRNVNPETGVWVSTYNASGTISGARIELDPLGTDVGATNPYVSGGTYEGMLGVESLYEERGNPFDLAGGCALDGLPISCSEAMQRYQHGNAELVVPVNYYVTARQNGKVVFSGYVGTGYANPADLWMGSTTTQGSFTPEQMQRIGGQLANQSFWAAMLNGSMDFGTSYGADSYSDDLGTHDISSPYSVNIFGGAAFIGAQEPVSDNPTSIDNSGEANQACKISVTFAGDSVNNMKNGENYYHGEPGLGFTVSITGLGAGGIKTLGENQVDSSGHWVLQQLMNLSFWTLRQGDTKPATGYVSTFSDPVHPNSIIRYDNQSGGWIDHPGPNLKNEKGQQLIYSHSKWNFLIKAYNGNKNCSLGFHAEMIYNRGSFSARWGRRLY